MFIGMLRYFPNVSYQLTPSIPSRLSLIRAADALNTRFPFSSSDTHQEGQMVHLKIPALTQS